MVKPRSRRETESEQGEQPARRKPGWSLSEQTRNQVIYPWPGRSPGNAGWKPEPVSVEDGLDELWVAVKCQSNLEIAGSPRNVFRYSLTCFVLEVEH